MLINGSFEEGYQPDFDGESKPVHRAYVSKVLKSGGPVIERYVVERGEVTNPKGWFTWYAHQPEESPVPWDPGNVIGWSEPETRLTETVHNRQRTGAHAYCLFTYRRINESGLLQRVETERGTKLRFTAYAHGWISNDDTQPPTCSLPGCGTIVYEDVSGLSDNQKSVSFRVGIDPAGGLDPYAESVVWGKKKHIFNGYDQLEVEATAMGPVATLFLWESSLWPVIHNDAYWDDCQLEELGRGYDCTVNVLPQETTLSRSQEILSQVYGQRQSVLYSHDDAARLACLRGDKIRLWDVTPGKVSELQAWYKSHGSQATVELAQQMWSKIFSQRDPRWKNDRMGNSPETLGSAGCVVTSIAMMTNLTPKELNAYLSTHGGYTSEGNIYWRVAEVDGLHFIKYHVWNADPANLETVRRCLNRHPCPVGVDFYPGGSRQQHFVLGISMTEDGKDINIIDPWNGEQTTLMTKYSQPGWDLARAVYNVAEYNRDTTVTEGVNPVGLHLQEAGPWDAVLAYVTKAQPGVIKVFDGGLGKDIKRACSKTKVLLRHYINNDDIAKICAEPVSGIAWFFDQISDDDKRRFADGELDYLESPNNEANSVGISTDSWAAADAEFIRQLKVRIPKARPVVATVSVGCPEPVDYPKLLKLARMTQEAKGAFGYHAYWPSSNQGSFLESDWQWHAGRWTSMDEVFKKEGIEVDWILTESGPCGGVMHTSPRWFEYDPGAGWKSPKCCNDDWERARSEINRMKALVSSWNATHKQRCIGFTLFTTCGWDWEFFRLWDNEIRSLGE